MPECTCFTGDAFLLQGLKSERTAVANRRGHMLCHFPHQEAFLHMSMADQPERQLWSDKRCWIESDNGF